VQLLTAAEASRFDNTGNFVIEMEDYVDSELMWRARHSWSFQQASAQDQIKNFLNTTAHIAFKMAWVSAKYDRYAFQGITARRDKSDGSIEVDFTVRLHGTSLYSGGPLWVDAVMTLVLNKGKIQNTRLHWGAHNAFLKPPGAVLKFLTQP
jgi:hypothetical protein